MRKYDIAIVGGGASGCYLAALLADAPLRVALIERKDRLGRKLAATGNGQGNVSNVSMSADRYFTKDKALVAGIVGTDGAAFLSLFRGIFDADERGRIYPAGRQASALTDSLRFAIERAENVDVLLSSEVTELRPGYRLTLNGKEQISAETVVLCAGGKAGKPFGTDGTAYALAQAFGHSVTPQYPSLVQLKTDTAAIRTLRGLRVDCLATAEVGGKAIAAARGDVIFADYGVTGSAVFSLSAFLSGQSDATLRLTFLPDIAEDAIAEDIGKKRDAGYARSEWLACTLNHSLGRAIMKRCGSDDPRAVASAVKNFTLPVLGTLGFDHAQVTKGGIPLSEVTELLESKYAKGLYFAGEILDVDGECGGYNLHWAFGSARRVFKGLTGS